MTLHGWLYFCQLRLAYCFGYFLMVICSGYLRLVYYSWFRNSHREPDWIFEKQKLFFDHCKVMCLIKKYATYLVNVQRRLSSD